MKEKSLICPVCKKELRKGYKVCCGVWHIDPISHLLTHQDKEAESD